MTPLYLDILLHYHRFPSVQYPKIGLPAVHNAIKDLIMIEILEELSTIGRAAEMVRGGTTTVRLTERGKAWIKLILDTPLPFKKTVWVDSAGNQINLEDEM